MASIERFRNAILGQRSFENDDIEGFMVLLPAHRQRAVHITTAATALRRRCSNSPCTAEPSEDGLDQRVPEDGARASECTEGPWQGRQGGQRRDRHVIDPNPCQSTCQATPKSRPTSGATWERGTQNAYLFFFPLLAFLRGGTAIGALHLPAKRTMTRRSTHVRR